MRRPDLLLLAAALGLAATGVQARPLQQSAYLSPNQAEADIGFQVTVSGKTQLCHPLFSHYDVRVQNGAVHLTVAAENDPTAKCAAGEKDYQADFSLPALKPGEYPVDMALQPACAYSATPCPFADMRESAGTLSVKDPADLGFSILPKQTVAGKAFDLFLAGKGYSCGNEYTGMEARAEGHTLYLSFTNRANPAAICPAIVKDYGPTFKAPALAVGVYQVFAAVSPYCGAPGPCPLALIAPQLAGALTVIETVASVRSEARGAGRGSHNDGAGIGNAAGVPNGSLRIDRRNGAVVRWRDAETSVTGKRY